MQITQIFFLFFTFYSELRKIGKNDIKLGEILQKLGSLVRYYNSITLKYTYLNNFDINVYLAAAEAGADDTYFNPS